MSGNEKNSDPKDMKSKLVQQLLACNCCTQNLLELMFESLKHSNNGEAIKMLKDLSSFHAHFLEMCGDKTSELYGVHNVIIDSTHLMDHSKCCVCWDDFTLYENVRKLNCSHMYHRECIHKWFQKRGNCPICRSNATPDKVTGDYYLNLLRNWQQRSAHAQGKSERKLVTISIGQEGSDASEGNKENNTGDSSTSFTNVTEISKALAFLVSGIFGGWRGNKSNISLLGSLSENFPEDQTNYQNNIIAISRAIDIMLGGSGKGWAEDNRLSIAGTSSGNAVEYSSNRRRNIEAISRSMYLLLGGRGKGWSQYNCINTQTTQTSENSNLTNINSTDIYISSIIRATDLLVSGIEGGWGKLSTISNCFGKPSTSGSRSISTSQNIEDVTRALSILVGSIRGDFEGYNIFTTSPRQFRVEREPAPEIPPSNRENDSGNSMNNEDDSNFIGSNISASYRNLGLYTNGRQGIWNGRRRIDIWDPADGRIMTAAGWSAHKCINIFGTTVRGEFDAYYAPVFRNRTGDVTNSSMNTNADGSFPMRNVSDSSRPSTWNSSIGSQPNYNFGFDRNIRGPPILYLDEMERTSETNNRLIHTGNAHQNPTTSENSEHLLNSEEIELVSPETQEPAEQMEPEP